nr:alpha/beta hydrolase-fold protein [Mammaliicoccus sp. Marseille-Q6498]
MQEVQKILWNNRLLTIAFPTNYNEENPKPFTTVIVQDGDYIFSELIKKDPKNIMFVGLEPEDRNSEYTPWEADVEGLHFDGKVDEYLDLVEYELIPFLKENYHIFDEAEYLTIGGASFGALTSLYALLTRPHLFGHYLLISVSMWYPDFVELIARAKDIEYPRHIYWYVGEQEGVGYHNVISDMVPYTYKGVELLKGKLINPDSTFIFETNPEGTHTPEYFEAYFEEGIQQLF